MDLLTPSIGLVFWTTLSFLVLLILLKKFAWKPILQALEEREKSIEDSLTQAREAKETLTKIQEENKAILGEARIEREKILQEANEFKNKTLAQAKEEAKKEGISMIAQAKMEIEKEKQVALNSIKEQVADLSVQVAEEVLRTELQSTNSQKELVDTLVNGLKIK